MMGAGNASASLYKTNPNINTFGGSKKQDIPTRVGIDAWSNYGYQTNANGIGRNKLFIMNQIGGVGVGRSMFNTSYVQPRGLRKIVDISDIAYWDGVQHVLKKNVTIPFGHSLTTTSTFTVGQGTTLTVLGNFKSQGHIIVQGVLNILGNHDHKKMTISSTGSYIVYGKSIHSSNDPILKTVIDDTETDVADVTNQGIFTVQSGGSYTNAFTFTNGKKIQKNPPLGQQETPPDNSKVVFTVNTGGQFMNNDTFINKYGIQFIMNGTYTNNGTFEHKTVMTETTGISGTFSNNGTLQLTIDNNYFDLLPFSDPECNMYMVSSIEFINLGTIIIDENCIFNSYVNFTNNGVITNKDSFINYKTFNNNGQIINSTGGFSVKNYSMFIININSIIDNINFDVYGNLINHANLNTTTMSITVYNYNSPANIDPTISNFSNNGYISILTGRIFYNYDEFNNFGSVGENTVVQTNDGQDNNDY
jgi:hypothetical protein